MIRQALDIETKYFFCRKGKFVHILKLHGMKAYGQVDIKLLAFSISALRGSIQKFPDWPSGVRTANVTVLCN
jgi:hypothetical protein